MGLFATVISGLRGWHWTQSTHLAPLALYKALFEIGGFSWGYLPIGLIVGLSVISPRLNDYGVTGSRLIWIRQLGVQSLLLQGTLWLMWSGIIVARFSELAGWPPSWIVLWGCVQVGINQGFFVSVALAVYVATQQKLIAIMGTWLGEMLLEDVLAKPQSPFLRFQSPSTPEMDWVATGLLIGGMGLLWGLMVMIVNRRDL